MKAEAREVNAEVNVNYGIVGAALGISDVMLLWQAGAARLRDHEKQGFVESEINAWKDRLGSFEDERDDYENIKYGIEKYRTGEAGGRD